MKLCLYARQQCRWPDKGCPRDEELLPLFASNPEAAVREVWCCEWAGGRLTATTYLIYLFQKGRLNIRG